MSSLVHVELMLTPKQIMRIGKGEQIQLSAKALHTKAHALKLHPVNATKLHKARNAHKGVRLQLSEEEMHASGIFDWLRDAGNWVKKNIIDSDVYQQAIRPAVREVIKTGIDALPVGSTAKDAARKVAEIAGQKSGAFGVRLPRHHGRMHGGATVTEVMEHEDYYPEMHRPRGRRAPVRFELSNSYSNLIGPDHPAMWPSSASLPAPGLKPPKKGGSFRVA